MLNRYTVVKPYRGFESLRHRHPASSGNPTTNSIEAGWRCRNGFRNPCATKSATVDFGRERSERSEQREDEKHAQGMFLVLAARGSLTPFAPKIACWRFCRTEGSSPIRLRHPVRALFVGRSLFPLAQCANRMAEPEGFEPSIGLYNPITV